MQVQLKVLRGCHVGRVLTIRKSGFRIGRDRRCDLSLKSHNVSRQHCAIVFEGPRVIVEDLGSCNGTFVNGAKIAGRHVLRGGDQVAIRPLQFEVLHIQSLVVATDRPQHDAESKCADPTGADEAFDCDVCRWMSTTQRQPHPGEEEHKRFRMNDIGAVDQADTVEIEGEAVAAPSS